MLPDDRCPVLKENEELRKENKGLKKEIYLLQDKIGELLRNFGKDEDGNQRE